MKIFFTLLLLTNIAFALVQWLFPYEQLIVSASPLKAAEQLRLVGEEEVEPVASGTSDPPARAIKPVQSASNTITGELCYTLGPFKEQQMAQEVVSEFRQNAIPIQSRSSVEKEYMGMMVFIDGHQTRKQAIETAESLKAKRIRDYIIVSEPDRPHVLSLGVFGLKKNADRRVSQISKLGYDVKSEPRYRDRTIYWLDYSQIENETLRGYIDGLKSSQGISRISRPCTQGLALDNTA